MDRSCLTPEWCEMIQEMVAKWSITSINDWWALKEAIKEEAKVATKWIHYEKKAQQLHLERKLKRAIQYGTDQEVKEVQAEWKEFERKRSKEILQHWLHKWRMEGDQLGKVLTHRVQSARNKQVIHHLKDEMGHTYQGTVLVEWIGDWYKKLFAKQKHFDYQQVCLQVNRKWGGDQHSWKVLHDSTPVERMHAIVKRARKEKAAGEDGLPAELYQRVPALVDKLWEAWSMDPEQWESGVGLITLLFKKGDRTDIGNWRPITLLNYDHKLLATLMLTELKELARKCIGKFQHGFVPGRRISDAILRIKAAQALIKLRGLGGILCIDFKKAYDTIQPEWIWLSMEKQGVNAGLISSIKNLLKNGHSRVVVNGTPGPVFALERGVRQGCPLLPTLFAFATVGLERLVNEAGVGLYMCGEKWTMDMFADDLTAYISSEDDCNAWSVILERWKQWTGLECSKEKSVLWSPAIQSTKWRSSTMERVLGVWLCTTVSDVRQVVDAYIDTIAKKVGSWGTKLPEISKAKVWNGVMNSKIRYAGHWIEIDKHGCSELDKIAGNFLKNGKRWGSKKYMLMPKYLGGCGAVLPSTIIKRQRENILKGILEGQSSIAVVWQQILMGWASSTTTTKWEQEWIDHATELRKSATQKETEWIIDKWVSKCQWTTQIRAKQQPAAIWRSIQHLRVFPQVKDFLRKWTHNLLPEMPWIKQCPWCEQAEGRHFRKCNQVDQEMQKYRDWKYLQQQLEDMQGFDAGMEATVEALWHVWKRFIEDKWCFNEGDEVNVTIY